VTEILPTFVNKQKYIFSFKNIKMKLLNHLNITKYDQITQI